MTQIAGAGIVGYVPGAWNMFHIGHLNILRRAAERCDLLTAGVVLDDVLAVSLGRLPVVPHAERMEIVGAMDCVDEVVTDSSSDGGRRPGRALVKALDETDAARAALSHSTA